MIDYVFRGLAATSPLADLCAAARIAGHRGAASDLKRPAIRELVARVGVDGFLLEPGSRGLFEYWFLGYNHDEAIVDALPDEARAAVLDAAWDAYAETVRAMAK